MYSVLLIRIDVEMRIEESEIPEMAIELSMLDKLKVRVQLAKQIENTQHKIKKTNYDRNWMQETAEALGVDLDSDLSGTAIRLSSLQVHNVLIFLMLVQRLG